MNKKKLEEKIEKLNKNLKNNERILNFLKKENEDLKMKQDLKQKESNQKKEETTIKIIKITKELEDLKKEIKRFDEENEDLKKEIKRIKELKEENEELQEERSKMKKEIKKMKKWLMSKEKTKKEKIVSIIIMIVVIIIIILSIDRFGSRSIDSFKNFIGTETKNNLLKEELQLNKLQLDRVKQLVDLFDLVKNPELLDIQFKNIINDFVIINHKDDNIITNLPIFISISKALKKKGYTAIMFGRLSWSTGGRPIYSSSSWTNETDLGSIKEYLKNKKEKIFFLGSNPGEIYLGYPFMGQTNGYLRFVYKESFLFLKKESISIIIEDKKGINFKATLYTNGDFEIKNGIKEGSFYKDISKIFNKMIPEALK